MGKPEAGDQFLQDVAQIIGGNVRRYEKNWPEIVNADGRAVDAAVLLTTGERWKAAARLIAELRTSTP